MYFFLIAYISPLQINLKITCLKPFEYFDFNKESVMQMQ